MDFESALRFLDTFSNFEKTGFNDLKEEDFQLKKLEKFLEDFGVDYSKLKFVHVAGSKGKGSVCSLIANYLWQDQSVGGVGFFSSPHILDVRERVWLDGGMVSKDVFASACAELEKFLTESDFHLTYFEVLLALALKIFVEAELEYVVLETGLGGRLDATNIVDPVLSIITKIELEHTEILGDKLEDIVREKLGIKKAGAPVLVGYQSEEVKDIFFNQLREVSDAYFMFDGLKDVPAQNRKLAMTALKFILRDFDNELFAKVAGESILPGRLDRRLIDGKEVVFDMAHTVSSAKALREFLLKEFDLKESGEKREFVFLFSMLKGKDIKGFLAEIKDLLAGIAVVECEADRGLNIDALELSVKEMLPDLPLESFTEVGLAFKQNLFSLKKDQVLVVTGSHFLVAKALTSL